MKKVTEYGISERCHLLRGQTYALAYYFRRDACGLEITGISANSLWRAGFAKIPPRIPTKD